MMPNILIDIDELTLCEIDKRVSMINLNNHLEWNDRLEFLQKRVGRQVKNPQSIEKINEETEKIRLKCKKKISRVSFVKELIKLAMEQYNDNVQS